LALKKADHQALLDLVDVVHFQTLEEIPATEISLQWWCDKFRPGIKRTSQKRAWERFKAALKRLDIAFQVKPGRVIFEGDLAQAVRDRLETLVDGPKKEAHAEKRRAWQREYLAKNKDKNRQWGRNYREKNREYVKAWRHQYYLDNQEKAKAQAKAWAKKNPKKVRAKQKKWNEKNKDKLREYRRKRYHENVEESRRKAREKYHRNKRKRETKEEREKRFESLLED